MRLERVEQRLLIARELPDTLLQSLRARSSVSRRLRRSAQSRLEDLLTATGQEFRDAQDWNGHSVVFQVIMKGQPRIFTSTLTHAGSKQQSNTTLIDSVLRIRDDGKGIGPKVLQEGGHPGHWRLPGIRERAKPIGAGLIL